MEEILSMLRYYISKKDWGRMFLSQQRKVLAEGNVKNVGIQGEMKPRVHCG